MTEPPIAEYHARDAFEVFGGTSPCPQHALTATPPTPRVLKLGRLVWHGPKADETPYPDDEQETL